MTTEGGLSVDIRNLPDRRPEDLLVLTDAQRGGRNALALPFRDATVIEVNEAETVEIQGRFDTVVIDRDSYDPRWLDSVATKILAALRPEGCLIVTLQSGPDASTAEPAALPGLAWQGLATLNAQPCAVLRPGDADAGSPDTGLLLATAATAVRLTGGQSGETHGAEATLLRHVEARGRSEHALLLHLRALADELDLERRRHRGTALIRTVLGRSRAGRAALRVLRPAWRATNRLRHIR